MKLRVVVWSICATAVLLPGGNDAKVLMTGNFMGQLDNAALEHPPQFSDNPARMARQFTDGDIIQNPDEPISVTDEDYCTYMFYTDKNDNSQGSLLLYLAYNSQCIGAGDLPKEHFMEGMPEPVGPYTPPMDLIPVGTGEYKMYIVLAKQPRKFDNEVADGGLTLQRMKDEKILTGEATWGFDFSRLVEVKSLQVVKAQFFQYENQCSLNTDCLNDQECQNPNCIDLECVDGNGNNYCESSAECRIDDHELECFCDSGLVAKQGTGGANEDDETLECVECNLDRDCADNEICNSADDTCQGVTCSPACGDHGYCKAIGNHEGECQCDDGYHYDAASMQASCVENILPGINAPPHNKGAKSDSDLSSLPEIDNSPSD